MTAFHIFAEPGKQESNFIHEGFQNILNAYGVFEKTVLSNLQELRIAKLNIPALVKIKLELTKSRSRIEKFVIILSLRSNKNPKQLVASSVS